MRDKIKILHLEDAAADADLVKRVLIAGNIEAEIKVVDDKEAYIAALIEFAPDLILSDHSLPSFNSTEALDIFLQCGMKIPFILVTGAMSESFAVSVIKAGASDYILKDNLEHLPTAILTAFEKIEAEIELENKKSAYIKEKTNAVLIGQENERVEMTNELIENISQVLAAANLYNSCAIDDEEKRMVFLQNSKRYILMAMDEIKKVSQVIMPPNFEEIGLIYSLDKWIKIKQQQHKINFITDWEISDITGISNKLQLTIYRIVQEQLNNTIKYSNAQNVYISILEKDNMLELIIKDDGIGFDTFKNTSGVGLQNINTRAEIHNGKMLLESQPGKGCLLKMVFPV